jgi:hypothetical protein
MTVDEMLNEAYFPKAELAYKYAPGEHDCYTGVIKEGPTMLMVKVTQEYYIRDNDMCIELEELFQLYNQGTLDKSIVNFYCL